MKPIRFIIEDTLRMYDLGDVGYVLQDDGTATVYNLGPFRESVVDVMNQAMKDEGIACRFRMEDDTDIENRMADFYAQ